MTRASYFNVADALPLMATTHPERIAIVTPGGGKFRVRRDAILTFAALDRLADAYAEELARRGIGRGERTLILIRPGTSLIASVFALMKIGSVPVLVDPGLGRRAFLGCVAQAQPSAVIAVPLAQLARRLFAAAFRSVRTSVTLDRALARKLQRRSVETPGREPGFPVADTQVEDEAAIAFTSGSTGPPKGVIYRQGNFRAQIEAMRTDMGIEAGEVHLAAVHLFALFNPALGVTTVLAPMDPARPARLDPRRLIEVIRRHRVTFSLGSPTIWRIVSDHCAASGEKLPHLRKVFMFGAPAPPALVARTAEMLQDGLVFTPFGATEALPLTLLDHREIGADVSTRTEQDAGVCVGRPIRGVTVRIIAVDDRRITDWKDAQPMPVGARGEIVVKGPVVTREYLNRPDETADAKIPDAEGFWHRMGDIGYLDELGRLWFCGRKSHRVETADGMLLPIPCESIFNQHDSVARSALVGIGDAGRQRPVLIVEPRRGQTPRGKRSRDRFIQELLSLGARHAHTRSITTVLFHRAFPMDVRHQAKICRELLASWAAGELG